MSSPQSEEPLTLRKVRQANNCRRVYSIRRTRTLFGTLALTIVWGRIGAARVRIEDFASVETRERRFAELLARRARNGYGLDES